MVRFDAITGRRFSKKKLQKEEASATRHLNNKTP
jgi:hypothetical protein